MSGVLKSPDFPEATFLLQSAAVLQRTAARAAASSARSLSSGDGRSSAVPSQVPPSLLSFSNIAGAAAVAMDREGGAPSAPGADHLAQQKEEFERRVTQAQADAKRRGYEEGLLEGRKLAQSEAQGLLQRLNTLLEALQETHRNFSTVMEDELVALVFAGISRIAGNLSTSRDSVLEVVRAVVAQNGGRLQVRIAPADHEMLSVALKRLEMTGESNLLSIVSDPRVALGGCILESDRGTLDARLETQMEQFRKALLAARSSASPALNP